MREEALSGHLGSGRLATDSRADDSVITAVARLYSVPSATAAALLAAGAALGAIGDALLRAAGPPGLNLSLWVAAVAVAAVLLHRTSSVPVDRERGAWLAIGVIFAAGFAWRDTGPLKLLALGCATLSFALAAHHRTAAWVRRAGVLRYAFALALGALHAWTAAILAFVDVGRSTRDAAAGRAAAWSNAAAVARGLIIGAPLVAVFGGLLMSADAVFEDIVANVFRFDFEWLASHVLLFSILAWISIGCLHGFLTGTDVPWTAVDRTHVAGVEGNAASKWLKLGITEVATALGALDLLFLVFVVVQFRYLFGGDTLVQVTPDLTYAQYARRGFFELVVAVVLVVPTMLAADWLLERRNRYDSFVFRVVAGLQVALVLAISASALQRLRLYHASYGLTEARFYAMVLLLWMSAMLLWFASTVLRGRRDAFAFGTLSSGLATVALLFAISPDALIARENVTRMPSADPRVRFDVAYATSLSADAVPVLIDAMPMLPRDVQCPLARHMLRRWAPGRERSLRSWNWSAARASRVVREHETQLRSMLEPNQRCTAPAGAN